MKKRSYFNRRRVVQISSYKAVAKTSCEDMK